MVSTLENLLVIKYDGLHAAAELQCSSCDYGAPTRIGIDIGPSQITGDFIIDGILNSLPFSSKIFGHNGYSVYINCNDEPERYVYNKTLYIEAESAKDVFERIVEIRDHKDASFSFNIVGSNCGDFVQDLYERGGFDGHWLDAIHQEEYPVNLQTLYQSLVDLI